MNVPESVSLKKDIRENPDLLIFFTYSCGHVPVHLIRSRLKLRCHIRFYMHFYYTLHYRDSNGCLSCKVIFLCRNMKLDLLPRYFELWKKAKRLLQTKKRNGKNLEIYFFPFRFIFCSTRTTPFIGFVSMTRSNWKKILIWSQLCCPRSRDWLEDFVLQPRNKNRLFLVFVHFHDSPYFTLRKIRNFFKCCR